MQISERSDKQGTFRPVPLSYLKRIPLDLIVAASVASIFCTRYIMQTKWRRLPAITSE